MTVAKDGPRTGGPVTGRGTPQSGIPTQGGFPGGPGPRPSGPFPMPPPPGWHAAHPIHPEVETSLVGPGASARRGRYTLRWTLIGVAAAIEVFVLFSAVMWWIGGSAHTMAVASVAPITWTGIVYDVGNAGVNLRADSKVEPTNSRDTAMRGSRLALSCGQTGDVVHKGDVSTATWLKTTDGLFVSMLYVRVPDRQSIPSCNGSKVDGPLLALADPSNPQLPPPPGTQLGTNSEGSSRPRVAAAPRVGAPAAAPGAVAPAVVPPGGSNGTGATSSQLSGQATAAAPTGVVAEGSGHSHHDQHSESGTHDDSIASSHATDNPDTTPVG